MSSSIVFIESNTTGTGILFFRRAVALGIEPILISNDPARYPALAEYRNINVRRRSLSAVLAGIEQLDSCGSIALVAGVWSSSDQGVRLAAQVAQRLGLPHADPRAIALCRDKLAARRRLHHAGLSRVACRLVRRSEEAGAFAAELAGPTVVKPRSATGSIGVRLCLRPEEASIHAGRLLDESATGRHGVLIEAFIEGPEYSVEIFDGVAIGVTRKLLGEPPTFVEIGHDFPAAGSPAELAAIARHAERATAAVGYLRGPAHVELRLAADGPTVIEINPRLAGGMIPELVRYATGIDLITASIQFACGLPYRLCGSHARAASIRYLLRPNDRPVRDVEGLSDARRARGIVEVASLDHARGGAGPLGDFRDRVAYVIALAEGVDESAHCADFAVGLLRGVGESQEMEIENA
jgi:biotin carboxylase